MAAEYLRMSTEVQDLSLDTQREALRSFAKVQGLTIVSSYIDHGCSGLTISHRPAMKRLMADVSRRACKFSFILVYDISRWGRFQDTDASAYYEYHCRLNGVRVLYVREPFGATLSPFLEVLKNLKRAMAAEYIRELASKTTAGQSQAMEKGYQMGSVPCLGIARVGVSPSGQVRDLKRGEKRTRSGEHIRWVSGPAGELDLVRRIFDQYANTEISVRALSHELAKEGIRSSAGRVITETMLYSLLDCEAFIGNFVWGRYDCTMRNANPARRKEGAEGFRRSVAILDPIVKHAVWERAQTKRRLRGGYMLSEEELLDRLRAGLSHNPALGVVDLQGSGCPSYRAYASAFGSFARALRMAGQNIQLAQKVRFEYKRRVQVLGKRVADDICNLLTEAGVSCTRLARQHVLSLNREVRVRVHAVVRRPWRDKNPWWIGQRRGITCDFALVVRIERDDTAGDLLLLPWQLYRTIPKRLSDGVPRGAVALRTAAEVIQQLSALAAARGLVAS
jgi:DNA invertase Pin-like site-specific DNA recombinase